MQQVVYRVKIFSLECEQVASDACPKGSAVLQRPSVISEIKQAINMESSDAAATQEYGDDDWLLDDGVLEQLDATTVPLVEAPRGFLTGSRKFIVSHMNSPFGMRTAAARRNTGITMKSSEKTRPCTYTLI
jgi:hypothetical protein